MLLWVLKVMFFDKDSDVIGLFIISTFLLLMIFNIYSFLLLIFFFNNKERLLWIELLFLFILVFPIFLLVIYTS